MWRWCDRLARRYERAHPSAKQGRNSRRRACETVHLSHAVTAQIQLLFKLMTVRAYWVLHDCSCCHQLATIVVKRRSVHVAQVAQSTRQILVPPFEDSFLAMCARTVGTLALVSTLRSNFRGVRRSWPSANPQGTAATPRSHLSIATLSRISDRHVITRKRLALVMANFPSQALYYSWTPFGK